MPRRDLVVMGCKPRGGWERCARCGARGGSQVLGTTGERGYGDRVIGKDGSRWGGSVVVA